MFPMELLAVGWVLSLIFAGVNYRMLRNASVVDRSLSACTAFVGYLLIATAIVIATTASDMWDAARLTPTVAFSKGFAIYSTRNSGAVLSMMYPPAWVLSYLPVVMAKSPVGVLILGRFLALAYSISPVVLLCFMGSNSKRMVLFAVAAFVFVATQVGGLAYSCFDVHADAPSLGFALLSCAALLHAKKRVRRTLWFCLSLTLAWLAIWSKQVMLPIIPALGIWVFLLWGFRSFVLFSSCAIGIGAILGMAMIGLFSPEGMLFNLVTIPARCPWTGVFPFNLARVFNELLSHAWGLVVFLLAGAVISFFQQGNSRLLQWLTSKSWALVTFVAICHIPMSILGRVKVGGAGNTLSPTLYFLSVGVCLLIVDLYVQFSSGECRDKLLASYKWFLILCSLVVSVCWFLYLLQRLRDYPPSAQNASQTAFDYLRNVGGEVYFPEEPLAHLMANGELYHLAAGLSDREKLSGIPVGAEQRMRYFPRRVDMVCWLAGGNWGSEYVRSKYFPDYDIEVFVKDLPGFRCFRTHKSTVETEKTKP